MLHHLITLLLLFVFSVATAQEEQTPQEDENKRPSWSAGLPERTKAADLSKPTFKPDNEIELDMSDFGLQETTEIEMDLPIGETIAIKAEKPSAPEQANENEAAATVAETEIQTVVDEQPVATEPEIEQPVVAEQVAEQPVDEEPNDLDQATEQTTNVNNSPAESAPVEQVVESTPPVTTEEEAASVADVDNTADAMPQDNDPSEAVASTPAVEDATEPVTTETAAIDQSIAAINPPVITEDLDPVEAATEAVKYRWEIIQQAPVKYPVKAAMENQEGWVDVEVTIDPSGQVVKVSPVKYSTRGRIFGKPAVQSVNDWLFRPPSEFGITENQTRVYKIEFEL